MVLRLLLVFSPWVALLGVLAFVADALLGAHLSAAFHQVHAQVAQFGSCLGGQLAACPAAPAG